MFRLISAAIMTTALTVSSASPLSVRDLDGKTWTPLSPARGDIHLLVFVTVDCPVANRYASEIGRIAADYRAKGVKTLLIYADATLGTPRVTTHMKTYFPGLPAVIDKDFSVTSTVGATVTPEAAIFTQAGRTYRGRVDDLYVSIGQARRQATRHDVRDVLDAIVSGRTSPEAEAQAFGCFIERIKR